MALIFGLLTMLVVAPLLFERVRPKDGPGHKLEAITAPAVPSVPDEPDQDKKKPGRRGTPAPRRAAARPPPPPRRSADRPVTFSRRRRRPASSSLRPGTSPGPCRPRPRTPGPRP